MKAERIVSGELTRLGWRERDLATRRKSDPDKLALGGRLRRETTLSIKWIAARLHLGTSKGANSNLHRWMKGHAADPIVFAPAADRKSSRGPKTRR
jgi:hypothetical protein